MTQARQIALTEVWLDERASAMEPSVPRLPGVVDWPGVVGRGLAVVGVVLLAIQYWRLW